MRVYGKATQEVKKINNVRSQKIRLYWPGTITSCVLQWLRWLGANSGIIPSEDSGLSTWGSKDSQVILCVSLRMWTGGRDFRIWLHFCSFSEVWCWVSNWSLCTAAPKLESIHSCVSDQSHSRVRGIIAVNLFLKSCCEILLKGSSLP